MRIKTSAIQCNRCKKTLINEQYLDHWKECGGKKPLSANRKVQVNLTAFRRKKRKTLKLEKTKWQSTPLEVKGINKDSWIYKDPRWKALRYETFQRFGFKCMACNSTENELHIDHIIPISKKPQLAFSRENLQVLCAPCNMSKSNKFQDDLRPIDQAQI